MRNAVIAVVLLLSAVRPSAQAPAPRPIEEARFDVVSIRPLSAGSNIAGYRPDQTRFQGYLDVIELLNMAYQIQPHRIVDEPEWARSERFEIGATISAPRQPGDLAFMLRHLLEERFALKVHRERRPMPVYVLVTSRSDGRLGPKLQRVERDCAAEANRRKCGMAYRVGGYVVEGRQWTDVVRMLELVSGRPVLDKTGLSGQFDLTLEWNPGINRVPEGLSSAPTLAELEARPILFTAVQEQLGLKLEASTEPVDVLVVDAIQRPTAN